MTDIIETRVQRNLTTWFINTMPITLTLHTRTRERTSAGGWIWVDGEDRNPQVMRLVEMSTGRGEAPDPVLTADGQTRYVQYELLAEWNATIGLWDWFEYEGQRWEVVEMFYYNTWERRAKVGRWGG